METERVWLTSDAMVRSARGAAELLATITCERDVELDEYSSGGIVSEMEARFAEWLGKPAAIWMPTGTLANHLAVRSLAHGDGRVIVQAESHLYRDSGDCAQRVSCLNLIPLGAGRSDFTASELQSEFDRCQVEKVPTRVGVVSIETPVRRNSCQLFDPIELERVIECAREGGARLHLDGARLPIAANFMGCSAEALAAKFDTVYVSLYKSFHAQFGAVLAGEEELISSLEGERRQFGGALVQAWMSASLALHHLDGWDERFTAARVVWEDLCERLDAVESLRVVRLVNGAQAVQLDAGELDTDRLRLELQRTGIEVPAAIGSVFTIRFNESLAGRSAADIASSFERAVVSASA